MKQVIFYWGLASVLSACTVVPIPVAIIQPRQAQAPATTTTAVAANTNRTQMNTPRIVEAIPNNLPTYMPDIAAPAGQVPVRYSNQARAISNYTPKQVPVTQRPRLFARPIMLSASTAEAPAQTGVIKAIAPTSNANMPPVAAADVQWVADKLYQNHFGADPSKLVAWSENNNYVSLGLGPFIWYPQTRVEQTDSFPEFIKYLQSKGHAVPIWLANRPSRGAPWVTKAAFTAAQNDAQMTELRALVDKSRSLQVSFMAERLSYALPNMIKNFSADDQAKIKNNYQVMLDTPKGLYPLLDYISFKGEGINPSDRYKGQGWGLMQVLLSMQYVRPGSEALNEFALAAEDILLQRIANSPADLREARMLSDWRKRVGAYRPQAILATR